MSKLKTFIPPPTAMIREIIVVTVGVLGAAWLISRFPQVQAFVQSNSVTVKDATGKVLY